MWLTGCCVGSRHWLFAGWGEFLNGQGISSWGMKQNNSKSDKGDSGWIDQGHCQEIYPLIHSSITNEDPSAADFLPWSLGTRQAVVQVPPFAPCFLADPWGHLAPFVPMCQQLLCCCFKALAHLSRLWANTPVSSRDAKAPHHSTAVGRRARGLHSRFT